MEKLKRGQKRGCQDLWKDSGGEDLLVEGFSAFENLPKKSVGVTLCGKIWHTKYLKTSQSTRRSGYTLYGTMTESSSDQGHC